MSELFIAPCKVGQQVAQWCYLKDLYLNLSISTFRDLLAESRALVPDIVPLEHADLPRDVDETDIST